MTVKESETDVLIVGAGPAGLMAATWMAHAGIKARIVDKRGTKIFNGQADGLQSRTLEIFDSFGFGHRAWRESNHMLEIALWNPDENGVIRRSDRIPDAIPGLSRFQQCVLHQGRIERFFLDSIKEKSDITVERGVLPTSLAFDDSIPADDLESYPITVTLQHLTEEEATPHQPLIHRKDERNAGIQPSSGLFRSNLAADDTDELIAASQKNGLAGTIETVKAKYVIGCDGAHSWTRRQLGFVMEGEQTDYIWGVLDIIPITDFPDIRQRCAIHSANNGSVMVIPRENKLVRLYIQMVQTEKGEGKLDRSKITPELILASAQKIMAPYKLDYDYCDWWTAYQIGQRVGSNFSKNHRIFLAGDAVHTHSPKAGQGMNVSMQDTYNLGWKIANVLTKTCPPSILETYTTERRSIAQALIDFDHKFSRLFSGRPAKDVLDETGVSMEEFKRTFEKSHWFSSGLSVEYASSEIVATPSTEMESLASNCKIGMRFPSYQVLNQSDARPLQFQEMLPSNGKWRIVVFAGDISQPDILAKYTALGAEENLPAIIRRYTPSSAKVDSVIEVLTLHAAKRHDVELLSLPEIYHPFDEKVGWDYWKVFVDDVSYHEGFGDAYVKYGVAKEKGCIVVCRPDQYVGWVGEVTHVEGLKAYLSSALLPRQ